MVNSTKEKLRIEIVLYSNVSRFDKMIQFIMEHKSQKLIEKKNNNKQRNKLK